MNLTPLARLILPAGSKAGPDTTCPVYSVTKHSGFVLSTEYFKKQVFSRELDGYKKVSAGDFAYATIHLDEGSVGIAPGAGLISPMYTVFRPDLDLVDARYLIRFLKSPTAMAQYPRLGRGSVHRRRSISLEALGQLQVPLPGLDEQRRVAALLDRADKIIAKRRRVLAGLATLPAALFVEMFGDPVTNPRGLPRAAIGSVAPVVTGNSPSRADPSHFGRDIEWIKSGNLGGTVATVADEWLSARGRAVARTAPGGSVLVTCIAGSAQSIGKSSQVDRTVAFNQQINAILPSASIDSRFLLWQLKTAPSLVRAKSTGGMKGLVSKSAFQAIEILVPRPDVQREFVALVERIDVQRAASCRALELNEELFASLQHRAFRGEL